MCRTKMAIDAAQPIPGKPPPSSTSQTTPRSKKPQPDQSPSPRSPFFRSSPTKLSSSSAATNYSASGSASNFRLDTSAATTSTSSRTSLSSLHLSLPENTYIYDFSEIRSATNNFLSKRYSATSASSSQSWRCNLNGKDVIIFQRKFQKSMQESELKSRLSVICRSHHSSIIKILGASISNDHIYLVYEFVNGSNLAICLRNPRNPDFTVLSTWMSRIQIATDLAHGLDYIHNTAGFSIDLVHKHVKSSAVIITEPSLNAKICHFGAADLCGETERKGSEITEDDLPELTRIESRGRQFEGVRGYMSPEFQSTGVATHQSDVYAFGVVILELLTGKEPVKYKYDKSRGEVRKISVIETATTALEGGDGEEGAEGRLRRWMDIRLKDSFPVEVAEKLTRIALECVDVDPHNRPDMRRVAGKISKLYLESKRWSAKESIPKVRTVLAQICKEEQHRNLARIDDNGGDGATFAVTRIDRSTVSSSSSSRLNCTHCRRSGHDVIGYFLLVEYPEWRPKSGDAGRSVATKDRGGRGRRAHNRSSVRLEDGRGSLTHGRCLSATLVGIFLTKL